MISKLVISSVLCTFFFTSIAQSESSEKEKKTHVKIVIVDDDGNTKIIEKEIDVNDADHVTVFSDEVKNIEWSGPDQDKEMIIEIMDNHDEDGPNKIIIKKQGIPDGPFLGIHMDKSEQGILISKVVEGSGAEAAGLQAGDILVKFESTDITGFEDLKTAMSTTVVGDKVKLTYIRDGKTVKTSAILGEQPENNFERNMIWIDERDNELMFHDDKKEAMSLEELKSKPFLGITPVEKAVDISGVMIFEVIKGTSAERLGLQTGDVIYDINGNLIEDFKELAEVLKPMTPNDDITIKFKRDGVRKEVSGKLGNRSEANKNKHYMMKEYHYDSDEMINVEVHLHQISDNEIEMLSKKSGLNLSESQEMDDVDILISPNPNDGSFELEFSSSDRTPISVMVYDLNGKEVYLKKEIAFDGNYKESVSLDNNESGAYFLIISQGDKVLTEKIVVQ